MNTEKLFTIIAAFAAENPDGFTFNISTLEAQKNGYAVARKETQNSFNESGLKSVIKFAIANNVACVGGWYDSESNSYYFDATDIYTDRESAVKAGKLNNQIAIFNIDNLEEIRL